MNLFKHFGKFITQGSHKVLSTIKKKVPLIARQLLDVLYITFVVSTGVITFAVSAALFVDMVNGNDYPNSVGWLSICIGLWMIVALIYGAKKYRIFYIQQEIHEEAIATKLTADSMSNEDMDDNSDPYKKQTAGQRMRAIHIIAARQAAKKSAAGTRNP